MPSPACLREVLSPLREKLWLLLPASKMYYLQWGHTSSTSPDNTTDLELSVQSPRLSKTFLIQSPVLFLHFSSCRAMNQTQGVVCATQAFYKHWATTSTLSWAVFWQGTMKNKSNKYISPISKTVLVNYYGKKRKKWILISRTSLQVGSRENVHLLAEMKAR